MFIRSDQGSIYLQVDWAESLGSQPWVLLLHGLGSCGEDWLFQRMALRGRYPLIVPDLPGLGRSAPLRGWPRVEDLAQSLAQVVDAFAPKAPVHVIGLSLGSAVALQMALDRPDRIRSLVLVNGFASGRQASRSLAAGSIRLAAALTGGMPRLAKRIADGLFPRPDQSAYRTLAAERIGSTSSRDYLRLLVAIRRYDALARLGSLRVPVLIVAGGSDATVPLAASQALADRIAGSRLEVVPGAGHALPVDSAEAFQGLLLPFLEAQDG